MDVMVCIYLATIKGGDSFLSYSSLWQCDGCHILVQLLLKNKTVFSLFCVLWKSISELAGDSDSSEYPSKFGNESKTSGSS